MGKILLCRNEKKILGSSYHLECYLNDQLIYKLGEKEKKLLEVDDGTYIFYCKTKSDVLPSYTKKINVANEIIKLDVTEGFIRPVVNISLLQGTSLNGLVAEQVTINYSPLYTQKSVSKSNESFLSKVVRIIIGMSIFIFGISLIISGNNIISGKDSKSADDYAYTIDSQGIDEYGFYKVTGTVINNTNSDVDGLQIEFKCYDVNGNSVDTVKTYTENLLVGETWSYEAIDSSNANRIDHCDFFQITPYTKIIEFK